MKSRRRKQSTSLQNKKSLPDAKSRGSLSLLKKELKRKEHALEQKSRELEIEASLEKVRAAAMSMRKAEDLLNVCEALFLEFRKLGFSEMRNSMINIHDDEKSTFLNYDYSDEIGRSITPLYYDIHPIIKKQIRQIRKANDAYSETVFSGKDLKAWKEFRKSRGEKDDPRISKAASLYYYFYSIGSGSIGISTFGPVTKEKLKLLKRFRNVFSLSYQRYMDIVAAQSQARDAQIEAALERIRSRTMAMHRSEELQEVILIVMEQFERLGILVDLANFNFPSRSRDWTMWLGRPGHAYPEKIILPYFDHVLFNGPREAVKKGMDFFSDLLTLEEGMTAMEHFLQHTIVRKDAGLLKRIKKAKGLARSIVLGKNIALTISNFDGVPYTEEQNSILKRFGKVFEQSYTRFLDLEKAEAQAREAQIETALEKIRSSSLAMHRSEELREVIQQVFEQMYVLNFSVDSAYFDMSHSASDDFNLWTGSPGHPYWDIQHIPYLDNVIFNTKVQAKKARLDFYTAKLSKEEKDAFFRHFFRHQKVSKERQEYIFDCPGLNQSVVVIGDIALGINNYQGVEFPEEQNNILRRFGKAFEQAYTRFLDLQKAEAQAREAQIEASLEHVRSSMMAMHQSTGLPEVMKVVAEQLLHLGVRLDSVLFFPLQTKNGLDFWSATIERTYPIEIDVPYLDNPFINGLRKAITDLSEFSTIALSLEDSQSWWKHLLDKSNIGPLFTDQRRQYVLSSKELICSAAVRKNSTLAVVNYFGLSFSEEENAILKRFANVFEQAYTRFLDIQKAEAQAREAQVEASLERVRSKTMAMHNSEDVGDTVATLFDELTKLSIKTNRCGILIFSDAPIAEVWTARSLPDGKASLIIGQLDLNIHPMLTLVWQAWSRQQASYRYEMTGEDLIRYYQAINDSRYYPVKFNIADLPAKEFHTDFFFPEGALFAFTQEVIPENAALIFKRFAGVFGQTYRRYLDLKKAEAQARQAQIEAAMEKVRARAMAMQAPDELLDVATLLRKEMGRLGVEELETSSIYVMDEDGGTTQCWYAIKDVRGEDKKLVTDHMTLRLDETWVGREMKKFFQSGDEKTSILMQGENRKEWINYCAGKSKVLEGYYRGDIPERTYHLLRFSNGYMGAASPAEISDESWDLLKRATAVFALAFTRFIDLQKAEAQAREARVELALERVRARTMGMHRSNELQDIVNTVFDRLMELDIKMDSANILVHSEGTRDVDFWVADGFQSYSSKMHMPYFGSVIQKEIFDAKAAGLDVFTKHFTFEEKNEFFSYAFEHTDFRHIPDSRKKMMMESDGFTNASAFARNISISIVRYFNQPFTPHEQEILRRFTRVFEQAYIRFLDLQKAEAQAREAQIEVALERVRARTMAMHKSDELAETAAIVFRQLSELGVEPNRLYIFIVKDESGEIEAWITEEDGKKVGRQFMINVNRSPVLTKMYEGWKEKRKSLVLDLQGTELSEYIHFLSVELRVPMTLGHTQTRRVQSIAYFSQGLIGMASPEPLPGASFTLLERFADVFNLTYTRFKDLKHAEAQAREARIEASLERLRAKAMAMQTSDELSVLVAILFEELVKLNLNLYRCIIWIIDPDNLSARLWMANAEDKNTAQSYFIPRLDHSYYEAILEGWKERKAKWVYALKGEEKVSVDQLLLNDTELSKLPEAVKQGILSSQHTVISGSFNNFGLIEASGPSSHSDEQLEILNRFGKVFDLSYTRFLDLKNAEMQAREARIQTSLERVRGKAMAMHSSKDLTESIEVFYHELLSLGLRPRRVGVALTDRESRLARLTTMSTTEQGTTSVVEGNLRMEGHWLLEEVFNHWLRQEEFHASLKGQEINEYYKVVRPQISYPDYPHDARQNGYYFMFPEGNVVAWTEEELAEEELNIFRRFTSVISLTYKRHKDLSDAEARAQIAVREASLDRVRAEIASMRTADDLQRITPLIWRELKTLGVPFFRCGVMIVQENQEYVDFYLSTPEGKPLAALHLKIDDQAITRDAMEHWRAQKIYTAHWDREEFAAFAESMMKQGQIQTMSAYQGGDQPPEKLTLQFIPFPQGMLYVGSADDLSPDQINLAHALGDAFSTAYARYEDFNKLETAKRQVEKTLTDLRQAQQQLVQSEKMASLGELTAGIAHEIQNPLNFVNNFSDVSTELLNEMKTELTKGNTEDALAIAEDVKQNLEKILHHGKRADGIVKSMLQHSRSSSGKKELTDINALADEYLRLSFHGLRAKDKSFNAKFETNLDPSVGQVSVIPQEIGRVILNLINNAFYAVTEKQKLGIAGYEPTVTVSSRKQGNTVEIRVIDNGTGIPPKVADKIFQPFFTTKPTGQGTGLGLSLSYDIITKGHGGELKVETKEGEGTSFIVSLPVG